MTILDKFLHNLVCFKIVRRSSLAGEYLREKPNRGMRTLLFHLVKRGISPSETRGCVEVELTRNNFTESFPVPFLGGHHSGVEECPWENERCVEYACREEIYHYR